MKIPHRNWRWGIPTSSTSPGQCLLFVVSFFVEEPAGLFVLCLMPRLEVVAAREVLPPEDETLGLEAGPVRVFDLSLSADLLPVPMRDVEAGFVALTFLDAPVGLVSVERLPPDGLPDRVGEAAVREGAGVRCLWELTDCAEEVTGFTALALFLETVDEDVVLPDVFGLVADRPWRMVELGFAARELFTFVRAAELGRGAASARVTFLLVLTTAVSPCLGACR